VKLKPLNDALSPSATRTSAASFQTARRAAALSSMKITSSEGGTANSGISASSIASSGSCTSPATLMLSPATDTSSVGETTACTSPVFIASKFVPRIVTRPGLSTVGRSGERPSIDSSPSPERIRPVIDRVPDSFPSAASWISR
jgi:hypothetical protein